MSPRISLQRLRGKIDDRSAKIGVIGMGYVGLPVAALFAEAGFDVVGVEIRADRVRQINRGESPIAGNEPGLADLISAVVKSGKLSATTDYDALRDREVVLIDVETPVSDQHVPGYNALLAALRALGPVLMDGALVVVESTIAPGTMDGIVRPALEQASGRLLGPGFHLGHCPERVMPGKLLGNLRNVSRVVGGMSPETAEIMVTLYGQIVHADLDPADCLTAELVKTTENAYRDVQIAFANEVALICEAVGGDVWKVRELVNKSPNRQMHLPGAGVGGHCIPKDPWLLTHAALENGLQPRLIPIARSINDSMPAHMLELLSSALKEVGRELKGARIGILGYSYLENSDDTRNSPSEVLVRLLREAGAEPVVHDPWVEKYSGDLATRLHGCSGIVLMVAHELYRTTNLMALDPSLREAVIVDGRGISRGRARPRDPRAPRLIGVSAPRTGST